MSFDPIKLSPSGAEIYYSGAYADATGATGAGGQYASTASSQGWDTVTFKNAATRVGIGSALPTGDDISTSANYSLAPAVVIGGTTPIGDVRGEGVGYIAQGGSSTIIPLKPNEFYSGALYATYAVGSTAKLTAKVGVGTAGFSSYYQGNFTTRDNYAFDTVLNVDTGNLNATGSGSGVYTIGDTITLQTSLIDRIGDSLNTVSSINDDAFVKGINISILNEDKSIAYSNYKTDYKNPSFTFTKQENIDIFGSFTENFGVKFSVENQDGQTHETDFLLYGNRLSIEKIYVSASGGTYLDENKDNDYGPSTSDIVASDDKLEAVVGFSHRLVNTSGTTGAINFNITFDQDPNFTNYDNLLVFANTGSSTFDTTTQNLLGTFPLSQLQNQNVRIFPDDGIVEGESNFFKFVASSEVGFYNELFTVGPYSIEPVEVGTDPILYNVGEQEIVSGNLSILGQDAGGLYSLGASGSGDGQRLTGPGGLPYLLSGDAAGGGGGGSTGTPNLQEVTESGNITTLPMQAASLTGSNGLNQFKGSTDDANGYVLKTRNYANDDLFNVRNDGHVGIGSLAESSYLTIRSTGAIIQFGTPDGYSIKSEEKAILGVISGNVFSTGSALLGGSGHLVSGDYDVIAGGVLGTISGGDYDFIGGGYDLNVNHSEYSVVAGGKTNSIFSGDYSVIGGGLNNLITGIASDSHVDKVAIVGGEGNKVISAPYTFIGAGNSNLISGTNSLYSAILGGGYNQIKESQFATILGGDNNRISFANHSVSAGNYSRVLSGHNGAFVFSDSRTANYDSPRGNTLSLRFQSGVFVDTDSGIYINGNPVMTGASDEDTDTLQSVTDRGATTTNNITLASSLPKLFLQDTDGTNQIAEISKAGSHLYFYNRDNVSNGGYIFLGDNGTTDTEFMRIATDGDVGIGSNTPSAKLDVAGGIKLLDNNYLAWNGSNTRIVGNSDYLQLQVAATDKVRIQSDGNVGIGTNTPRTTLHVSKAGTTEGGIVTIDNPNTTDGSYCGIEFINSTVGYPRSAIFAQRTGGYDAELTFHTSETNQITGSDYPDATERMRIDHDGNVGIGSNNPNANLDVGGSMQVKGEASWAGTDNQNGAIFMDTAGRGLLGAFSTSYARPLITANSNYIDLGSAGTSLINGFRFYAGSSSASPGTYNFYTSGSNNRLHIAKDGKVGIGTDTPQEKLHVYNAGTARVEIEGTTGPAAFKATNNQGSYGWYVNGNNDSFRLYDFGASTDYITVSGNGNVAIGTDLAPQKFNVKGTIVSLNSSNIQVAGMTNSSDAGRLYANNAGGVTKVLLDSNGDSYLNGGNVGIGTNSVGGVKLDVRGNITGSGSFFGTGDGGRITKDNIPYLLSGDAAASLTLQNVCDNGNTTTTSILSTGPHISGVTGFYSDRVGIGNTHPQDFNAGGNNLVVGSGAGSQGMSVFAGAAHSASLYFAKGTAGADAYRGWVQYRMSNDRLDLGAGGGRRMVIDGNGVGIGTYTVDKQLTVSGNAFKLISTATDANNGQVRLGEGSNSRPILTLGPTNDYDEFQIIDGGYWKIRTRNTRDLALGTNNTDAICIKGSTQQVGISTTTPSGELHVYNGASSQSFSTQGDELLVESSDHGGISILTPNAKRGHLYFNNDAFLRWVGDDDKLSINTSASSTTIAIAESAGDTTFGGSVGIGTTNTLTRLVVDAPMFRGGTNPSGMIVTDSANGAMALELGVDRTNSASYIESRHTGSNTSYTLLLNAGYGKVGVGTVSPTSKFEVGTVAYGTDSIAKFWDGTDGVEITNRGGSRQQINFLGSNTSAINASGSLFINYDGDNNGTNDTITFARNGADENGTVDMVIKEGDVGIGTNSPISQFHITGASPVLTLNSPSSDFSRIDFVRGATSSKWDINHTAAGDLKFRENTYAKLTLYRSNGRVGIGSEIPAYTLDVAGDIQAKDSAVLAGVQQTAGYIFHDFGTGWGYKGSTSASRLGIFTDTVERITIASNGNVGIGSTSPAFVLDTVFAGDNGARIKSSDNHSTLTIQSHSSYGGYIRFTDGANRYWIHNDGNDSLYFRPKAVAPSSNVGVVFDETGRVGIGTSDPDTRLHVKGTAIRFEEAGGSTRHFDIIPATAGVNHKFTSDSTSAGYEFYNNANSLLNLTNTEATFNTSGENIDFRVKSSGSTAIFVDASIGTVGINQSSPSSTYALDVGGSIRMATAAPSLVLRETDSSNQEFSVFGLGGDFYVRDITQSTYPLKIEAGVANDTLVLESGGNVGIGTNNPISRLNIKSSATSSEDSALSITQNGGSNTIFAVGERATNGAQMLLYDGGTATHAFYTDGTANYINAGNVGIGTDSPSETLHVFGTTRLGGRGYTGGASIEYASFSETNGGASTIVGNAVYAGNSNNTYRKTRSDDGNFIALNYNKGITFHTHVTGSASSTEHDINKHEQMRLTTGGLLGIGTDDPEQPFHVAATNYKPALIQRTAGTNCYLLLEDQNTTVDVGVGATTNDLKFRAGNSDHMKLDAGGDLFLGSPTDTADKLMVQANTNYHAARFNGHTDGGQSYGVRIRAGTNSVDYGLLIENTAGADLFKVDGVGDVTGAGNFYGTGAGNRITNDGTPYLLSGDAAAALTLQDVCDNGNTTTTSIVSTGPHISGTTGLFENAKISNFNSSDYAAFGHENVADDSYAIRQHSNGNVHINCGSSRLIQFRHQNSTQGGFNASKDFFVGPSETNNTFHVDISETNVGVGTYAPIGKLTVATTMSSSPTTQLYLDVDGSNTVGGGGEVIFNTSASAGALDAFNAIVRGQRSSLNDGSSDLTFLTTHVPTSATAAARMTIKDDGKVGIGTISPAMELDISGNLGSIRAISTGGGANLYLNSASSNLTRIRWNSAAGSFAIRDDSNSSDRVTIDSDGNVGIGIASPKTLLDVDGAANHGIRIGTNNALIGEGGATGTQLLFWNGTSAYYGRSAVPFNHTVSNHYFRVGGSDQMAITSVGVGVGTASPIGRLDVFGANNTEAGASAAGNYHLHLHNAGDDTDESIGIGFGITSATDAVGAAIAHERKGSSSYGDLYFSTRPVGGSVTERMRITATGHVGIGTNSPSYELDVIGTTRSTYYIGGAYFEENASSSKIKFYPNGTILVLDEDGQLKPSEKENDTLVFGVSKRDFEQPIVLGAEPILITGPIEVGDYIVTSNKQGHGQAMKENKFGTVIAQAMEKGDGESYNIKAMIRKM